MREFNENRIRGSNPTHYNCTPNAILPDDLVTHLLKYYGHIVLSDKYTVYDNKVLEYETIKQLSLPGNSFDLSLAEMGLKHTSFYNKLMDYLKENIYIPSNDLKEYSSRSEVSEEMHKIVGNLKEKMEDLITMQNDNNSLTPFNALEAANEQNLKELGALLYKYERLLKNAQALSLMGINGVNCGCVPPPPPPSCNNNGSSSSNSIMGEISNLQNSKLDKVEANNKFATKESIPDITGLASKDEVSNNISKAVESSKNDVLRTVSENYQEKVYSGNGIKIYDGKEITADTKVIATREFVEDQIDAAKIQAAGKEIDLTSYAKKVDVEKKADKIEVEKKIDSDEAAKIYATKNELKYKADAIDLDSKLNIDDAKRTYATIKQIPDMSDVVVYEDLDKVKYTLERAINKKADVDKLSEYATTGDLAAKMDKGLAEDIFARKNDLNSKANKTDLNGYVTVEEVISKINEAKLSGDGQKVDLSIYPTKSEVSKNITATEEKVKAELYNSLGGKLDKVTAENTYAKIEQIPSINHLASKEELTKAITDASTNYVNKVAYELEKVNYADKEEVKVKIDKTEANEKFATKESLDAVEKKVDAIVVPSIEGLAKSEDVDKKIAAIQIPSIAGLATEESVNAVKTSVDEKLSKVEAADAYVKKETLNAYATQDYVKDQINQAQLGGEGQDVDLSAYALKTDTEKAINDAKDALNVVIENKIDKSVVEADYAKKNEIPVVTDFITSEKVDEKIAAIQIPSVEGLAKAEDVVAKEAYEADKATFATKDELGTKVDEATVDQKIAGISIPSVDGLATKEEVTEATKDLASKTYVTEQITNAQLGGEGGADVSTLVTKEAYEADKATFATKDELGTKANSSDIPDITGLATKEELTQKLDAIVIPDVSGLAKAEEVVAKTDYDTDKATFATKEELDNKADASAITDFITASQVDEKIAAASIPGTDVATLVKKETYDADKATFATKDELGTKANSSDIPDITGLAKSEDVVSKTDYTADKETFALKTALEELTTKYNDLLARVEKLENPTTPEENV